MSLDHIRLSTQAKEQLIRLKRATGIKNWTRRHGICLFARDGHSPHGRTGEGFAFRFFRIQVAVMVPGVRTKLLPGLIHG